MKSSTLRVIIAAVVFVALAAGLVLYESFGTLSGFGWQTISLICPLGALASMIAAKTLIPRAVVSIVIMAVLVFIFGRAFCGWLCPVPLMQGIRSFFRPSKKRKEDERERMRDALAIAKQEMVRSGCANCQSSCATKRAKFDSRHYVLAGSLLSAALFGYPVFCLVCPIGLSFAAVLLVWRLFAFGDMTLTVVIVIAMLVLEMTLLRKWCTRFCPLSGLMNLVSRFSRTMLPHIDDSKCLETASNTPCSRCASVCDADINLRHIEYGERTLADCTRCRACVEVCPTKAISMPLIRTKNKSESCKVVAGEFEDKVDA